MVENSKQVRVDNWGIFFLQRLQLFFNKTDYCDLTLQFEGNVQLKVHRLVMNACTEYFQFLEQTCETIDDVLIMPPDLQADVVLPIVNFMYTGMLEFHPNIFDKLYKTADLMNITVLTKLLDAQKQPPSSIQKPLIKKNTTPYTRNIQTKKISPKTNTSDLPPTLPGRKLPVWKRKSAPIPVTHPSVQQYYTETKRAPPSPLATIDNTPKPTRFEWPEDDLNMFNLMDSTFGHVSYTSKPLVTYEEEMRMGASTSFDDIKQTANLNKAATKSYSGNVAIDMEEVKNYVKEQKIRSDLVEYDDDETADNDLEVYVGDRNEPSVPSALKRKADKVDTTPKRVRFNLNEKENKEMKINVTSSVKSSEMDHTKIIAELLKKYPNLMKKNKNIRLKIMTKSNKQETTDKQQPVKTSTSKMCVQVANSPTKTNHLEENKKDEGPWICNRCSTPNEPVEFVLYYLFRKHMTDVHNEKFDSRMCKYCGHKSSKHNMLMYHLYTKHGIKPPPAYNFPKCSRCPYIALTEALLIKHKLNHTKFELQCVECKVAFNSKHSLTSHMQITGHTGKSGKNNYDCQYCTKRYQTGANLFSHIKMLHREEARRDGIVSIDETEDVEELDDGDDEQQQQIHSEDEYITPDVIAETQGSKVKIISNLELPVVKQSDIIQHQNVTLEPSSEAEALSNVASGIATSLGLVDIVVLDDNHQYILHSTDQQLVSQQDLQNNQTEFILPELTDSHGFTQNQNINEVMTSQHNVITQSMLGSSDIASTDELVMVLTDHDYGDGNNELINNDNSNIVVLYSHPVDGQENQFITSQGNLMVNSQTGMIEIRNGATIATTTSEQLVVGNTQDTHIESIEMIQKEIESHAEIKQDYKPSTSAESNIETVHQGDNQVQYNTPDLLENACVPSVVTSVHQATETTQSNMEFVTAVMQSVTESVETPSEVVEEIQQPTEEDIQIKPEVEENSTPKEVVDVEERQIEEEITGAAEETTETDVKDSECEEQPTAAAVDAEDSTTNTVDVNEEQKEEVHEPENEVMEVEENSQESFQVNATDGNEIVDITNDTNTTDVIKIDDNDSTECENEANISSSSEMQVDDKPKDEKTEIEETKEENNQQETPENEDCGEATVLEKEEPDGRQGDSDTENQVQEPEQIETSDEVSYVQQEESNSQVTEDVKNEQDNETVDIQEDSSQFIDDISNNENSQSHDDNSQSSHNSQSSQPIVYVKETTGSSNSAKISILDDWEDTDSQQSEHVTEVKSGCTVNKLIDDWADDDDDEGKKSP